MAEDFAVRAFGLLALLALPAILLVGAFGVLTGLAIIAVPLVFGLLLCATE